MNTPSVRSVAWTATPGLTAALLAMVAVAVVSPALAHDTWVITHDQESIAHAKPAPEIFTTLGVANVAISLLALLGVVGWIVIGRTTIPDRIAQRLGLPEIDTARLEPWVPTALRLGLAAMFVTAAFALHPRLGYQIGESPVLFASDLEFQHVPGDWTWLIWLQVGLGAAFLLGAWTRAASVLLVLLVLVGFWLFGVDMLAYAGVLVGTAYYLFFKGGGRFALLGDPDALTRLTATVPAGRPQAVLRILTGLSFLYLGILYKFLHPTYLLAGVEFYDLPLFGFPAEVFVFIVATVEVVVGVLITAGVMVRPLSLVLVFAFAFFSVSMNEGILGHSFLYGIVFALFVSGAGRWSARDGAGRGSLAASH
jgi:uncharacterized membrane protein YphA (DoxX/SURF4 family)